MWCVGFSIFNNIMDNALNKQHQKNIFFFLCYLACFLPCFLFFLLFFGLFGILSLHSIHHVCGFLRLCCAYFVLFLLRALLTSLFSVRPFWYVLSVGLLDVYLRHIFFNFSNFVDIFRFIYRIWYGFSLLCSVSTITSISHTHSDEYTNKSTEFGSHEFTPKGRRNFSQIFVPSKLHLHLSLVCHEKPSAACYFI